MFQGFTDATVDFMWGIRFNNERAWFEAHKQEYLEQFYRPMRELGDELFDHVAPQLEGFPLMGKVSRIYRDARRLHGRGPYKDHLWTAVEAPHEQYQPVPSFWFELGPEGWSCGMGCYMPKPMTMAKLRARIRNNPAEMEKLTRRLRRQSGLQLVSPQYKRPKPGAPSDLLAPWFSSKGYTICHDDVLTDDLFSREIVDRVKEYYDFLVPFYRYFATLDGDPVPEERT